ncbi:MAG: hypothetical protein FJ138_11595 [Deltaproteobacteria bacterium]|nr:hypothetical protein [Deltaproteobacteria bacterium]
MTYSAYLLTESCRARVLARFPARHPEVIAHHITVSFPDSAPPPPAARASVVGVARGDRVECLVVEIDGAVARPDGGTYHITLSLDRAAGAKPVESNHLLARQGWEPVAPLALEVEPRLLGGGGGGRGGGGRRGR